MTYLVLATVRNVLGEDTEIAADKLGVLSIKDFSFGDRIEAIKAAFAVAEEFRIQPERANLNNGELVYVHKVKVYRAYENENGDIDYDNLEDLPSGTAYIGGLKRENWTYVQAYAKLAEYLSEYFRLFGLLSPDEHMVQIDGISSFESSEEGGDLSSLKTEVRFTLYDIDGGDPIRFTGAVTQSASLRFFPSFGAPFKEED